MTEQKFMRRCDLCESQFQFGPHRYDGKHLARYLLTVCSTKYSGKSFRKVIWKADQQSWTRLHEEAFFSLGGSVTYVVLDNLKQGVIKPDLYEPRLNPVYAAMLAPFSEIP